MNHNDHQENNVEEVNEAALERAEITRTRYKKLMRKLSRVFFGFALIAFIPLIFNRYNDFDVIRNSPYFFLILVVMVLYTAVLVIRYRHALDPMDLSTQRRVKTDLDIMDLTAFLTGLMAFLVLLNAFALSFASVDGASMEPTFSNQDDIIIFHAHKRYERFDIVVVKINDGTYYVKRLIGLPGDTIRCEDGVLSINDTALDEAYIANPSVACRPTFEVEVPENHVFVLGDNRENSMDSSSPNIGPINQEHLFGRVIFRVRPLHQFGRVN